MSTTKLELRRTKAHNDAIDHTHFYPTEQFLIRGGISDAIKANYNATPANSIYGINGADPHPDPDYYFSSATPATVALLSSRIIDMDGHSYLDLNIAKCLDTTYAGGGGVSSIPASSDITATLDIYFVDTVDKAPETDGTFTDGDFVYVASLVDKLSVVTNDATTYRVWTGGRKVIVMISAISTLTTTGIYIYGNLV